MEEINKDSKYCKICREAASFLCFDCVSYLCNACFKFIHDKKINQNHKTEKVDYFIPFDLQCQLHPKDRINLFCLEENGK